jgi:hypothetical protein
MEQVENLKDISKEDCEKYTYKTKDDILKNVFSSIMSGNQTICIKGRNEKLIMFQVNSNFRFNN